MTTYNFSVNPRLSLNIPTPGTPTITGVSGISNAVIRAAPPPTAASHLMAMHPLMGSTRPILITPQAFPVSANQQIFGDRMFSTSAMTPVLSSGLNDAPLEFNVLRQKTFDEDQSIRDSITSPSIQPIESQDKQNLNYVLESQEKSFCDRSVERDNGIDSDSSECQIIADIHCERTNNIRISSQKLPVMTNSNIWNNLVSNINFPVLGVNQMFSSNIIDPNLFVGQPPHYGVFNNALSQLSSEYSSEVESSPSAKSVIYHKNCTLFPPNANAPAPTTRDRPQGCKTVFVGGLPENVTEDLIGEVFAFCGEIMNIRLSNKKFCHIRFSEESAVDRALTLSGYRMRLASSSESSSGRLHIDFAHARDDQYEWECKQRQIQREQRHRERILHENYRELSPSGPSHYTESEANGVLEKLKGEDTYLKAISVALCWLDRGECNKRNVNTFYGMIQSVNSHIRRLLNEKCQCETEYNKAKDLLRSRALNILTQFAQIEKLFVSSSHKKVWDHFTKAQRKNIEMWKKTAMEIKKLPIEAHETINDEMDVSDSDSDDVSSHKKRKLDVNETNSLNDENDSLRCQLQAYKNEIGVVRSELQCEVNKKDKQISLLQETLNSFSQEMNLHGNIIVEAGTSDSAEVKAPEADTTAVPFAPITEYEAKIIGLISIFLNVHPFGAGVEYIYSFLQKTLPTLKVTDIEQIMAKFPSVFQQEVVGIGANMERRWKYAGFNIDRNIK